MQQAAARKEREQRELARRKKQLERISPPSYLLYMLVILSVVYIVDEITSIIYNSLQSEMITDFFVNGMGLEFNTGLATYSAMTAPLYVIMLITPFYKSLADRFGRKLFLVLNTVGMGIGMFVCMIPSIVAVIVGLSAIVLMPETPTYLKRRIAYLEMTDEERAALHNKEKKSAENSDGGVVAALKYIFKHKQMRAVALCAFITDYLGRKRSCVALSSVTLLGLISFVLSASFGAAPALVGISYGFFIGGLWSVADILFIMIPGESTPTNLRVSVVGTMGVDLSTVTGSEWD